MWSGVEWRGGVVWGGGGPRKDGGVGAWQSLHTYILHHHYVVNGMAINGLVYINIDIHMYIYVFRVSKNI